MLKSLKANDDILNAIVRNRTFTDVALKKEKDSRINIKTLISAEDSIWTKTIDFGIAMFEPIARYIVKFQSDKVPVSDVYAMWSQLITEYNNLLEKNVITEPQSHQIFSIINKRKLLNGNIAQKVAYRIDPNYIGCDMHVNDAKEAVEFINNWKVTDTVVNTTILQLIDFENTVNGEVGVIPTMVANVKNKLISVLDFWKNISKLRKDWVDLTDLAIKVFSLVASSCASERNFSTLKFIHSNLRNRLKYKKIEKLVYIFANDKLLKGIENKLIEDELPNDSDNDLDVIEESEINNDINYIENNTN